MAQAIIMESNQQLSYLTDTAEHKQKNGSANDEAKRKPRSRANDLDGAAWTRNSISIWSDIRKSKEEQDLNHPAIFPAQLVQRVIETFTRSDERVILDPFCGSGSTVVVASRMGRIGLGFETNPEFVQLGLRRLASRQLWQNGEDESHVYTADARDALDFVDPNSVDLIFTSPPYWDILSQKRSADGKEIRDYGNARKDLGKITDYREFLGELAAVFSLMLQVLKPGKYCIVNVMDLRKKSEFYPLHSDLADKMQEIGFIFDDLFIWDRRHEYNNMRPLGYPSVFRVNKCHEYLLVFQKPR